MIHRQTELVQQRNGNDCGLAAMAMALGKEYDELWTEEHVKKVVDGKGISDIDDWLEELGLKRNEDFTCVYSFGRDPELVGKLLWRRPALLSIASLNEYSGTHLVYYDGRRVWDPQEGREGKLFVRLVQSCVIERVVLLHPRHAYQILTPVSD